MSEILLVILIVGGFLLLFIITYVLNQNYRSDQDVWGYTGNCEKCELFSCHKHPEHEQENENEKEQ